MHVGGPCEPGIVDVTARTIEGIPRGNLRVPRSEFATVWVEAERLCGEAMHGGSGVAWYAVGVAETCRWIAGASVVFNYPSGPQCQPADAPVTGDTARAHEELIEAEALAAERLAATRSGAFEDRPEWVEAIVATFAWAWRGSGVAPLDIRHAQSG